LRVFVFAMRQIRTNRRSGLFKRLKPIRERTHKGKNALNARFFPCRCDVNQHHRRENGLLSLRNQAKQTAHRRAHQNDIARDLFAYGDEVIGEMLQLIFPASQPLRITVAACIETQAAPATLSQTFATAAPGQPVLAEAMREQQGRLFIRAPERFKRDIGAASKRGKWQCR
jgi:hypothetical protein